MTKTRIIMRVTPDSEVARLQRLLRGLPPRKPFVFIVDQTRDVGKTVKKPGSKQINQTQKPAEPKYKTIDLICKFCGTKSVIKAWGRRRREYCNDNCRASMARKRRAAECH